MKILRGMKEALGGEGDKVTEVERWGTFRSISEDIMLACEERDLDALARATRALKNKLRRPAVRRALAEAEKEKIVSGQCGCAQCGSVIEDSEEECIEGALCSKCALKNKTVSLDSKAEKKARKSAAKVGMEKPEVRKNKADEQRSEGAGFGLRRRGYVG